MQYKKKCIRPRWIIFLFVIFLFSISHLSFADNYDELAVIVLGELGVANELFPEGTYYEGKSYKEVFLLSVRTTTSMRGWVDDMIKDINRRKKDSLGMPAYNESERLEARKTLEARVGSSFRNRHDLFFDDIKFFRTYSIEHILEFRRVLNHIFEVAEISHNKLINSTKFPELNGLPLYGTMLEAYLRSDSNHLDAGRFLYSQWKQHMEKGISKRMVKQAWDPLDVQILEEIEVFWDRYGQHSKITYVAAMKKRVQSLDFLSEYFSGDPCDNMKKSLRSNQ